MKILFLFTYNQGLLSNFFMELGQMLSEDEHEVKVFSLKRKHEKLRIGNIEIRTEAKGGYLSNYYRIFNYIKEVSPDVIISNFSYDNPALLAGKVLKIKKNFVWVHSLKKHGDPGPFRIILKRKFYQFANRVIVNSLILEDELEKVFKVKKSKIIPIPFWSNIEKIDPTSIKIEKSAGRILIGCPGRLTIIKNQKVIVDAILILKDKIQEDVEVYFAGEGPALKELESRVNEEGLGKQVNFLGVLSAGEMHDFYKKMDVVVLPSLYESFGLVFIEAISLGTPVIVSTEFGALNFVNKETKNIKEIMFDPRNPQELAEKLQNILEEKSFNKTFFKNLYSEHFDKDVIYEKVLRVLKD